MSSAPSTPRPSPGSNEQKYQTRNPVVRRLLARFLEKVAAEVAALAPARVVDLGCGEGLVATRLREAGASFEYLGLDRSPEAVARARAREPSLHFEVGDVLGPAGAPADVVLCLEVLEHLEEPGRAIQRLAEWSRHAVIVSVPWEPWFRLGNLARGQWLARLGNHPDHVQAFGPRRLAELLARELDAVRVVPCFPWLIGVGRRR